jgi:hypothetical protein
MYTETGIFFELAKLVQVFKVTHSFVVQLTVIMVIHD